MKTERGRTVYGGKAVGLVSYLLGPGRANEHVDQHVVCGSASVMASHVGERGGEWTPAAVHAVGHGLERDFRRFDGDRTRGHIFHVSMSLHPSETAVSDERWEDIARRYVAEMGFTDHASRPDCEWVAARHGAGRSGQDHVHVAVCLVRPDGTRAEPRREQPRAAALAAAFERDYGLRITRDPGAAQAKGSRALGRAELEKAARGRRMPDRRWCERAVRAAGTAAEGEAEFVRRLRSGEALVRPYYAAGGRSEVTGYSVARKPTAAGERPVWFGGGRLARDLTLPALRGQWGEDAPAQHAAVAEWTRAARARSTTTKAGAETRRLPETSWTDATSDAAEVNAALGAVPATDRARWEQTAADAAGVFAAWSARIEGEGGGPLQEASRALAASAQSPVAGRRPARPRPRSEDVLAVPAAVILQAAAARSDTGWLAVMVQLQQTTAAIAAAHTARGERVAAGRMLATVNAQVQTVRAGWDAAVQADQCAGQAAAPAPAGERWRTVDPAAFRRAQDAGRARGQDRDYGR